jgi:hypothetical protein
VYVALNAYPARLHIRYYPTFIMTHCALHIVRICYHESVQKGRVMYNKVLKVTPISDIVRKWKARWMGVLLIPTVYAAIV